jgi:hypothetical protein
MLNMPSTLRKLFQGLSLESVIICGLIFFGMALRLRQYLAWRSLWLDEAMLALNIVGRDFSGLLQPLDYNQGGPVGFLLAEKLSITLLGNHELTLRLVPLLAGCAALPLFALLLRQGMGKTGTFTALALFAAGAPLIYYASEVKQYSSDVFIAVLLLWLAGEVLVHEEHEVHEENIKSSSFVFLRVRLPPLGGRGKKIFLTLAGILAVWCSHPALFVLAGISSTLLLRHAIQKDYRQLKQTLAMIALWAASFAALYFVSLRGLAANPFLLDYWSTYFMPLPPWANWGWFPTTLQAVIENPAGLGTLWLIPAALMLIGLVTLLRRKRWFGALLALTLLATLTASGLGKYPFVGRMILFAAPIFLALVGAGVDALAGWLRHLHWLRAAWLGNVVAILLAGVLLYQPLVTAAQNFASPKYYEHIRPTMAYLQANHKPGDVLYVYYWAVPAFRYYAPFYGFTENDFIAGNDFENNPPGLLTEIDHYKGQKRLWVLFSHVYENGTYNDKDALLAHLDHIGVKKREFIAPGTSVSLYLYDLNGQ